MDDLDWVVIFLITIGAIVFLYVLWLLGGRR